MAQPHVSRTEAPWVAPGDLRATEVLRQRPLVHSPPPAARQPKADKVCVLFTPFHGRIEAYPPPPAAQREEKAAATTRAQSSRAQAP